MHLKALVKRLCRRTGYPFPEAWALCDEFVRVVVDALASGEEVKIRNLGTFRWEKSKGRSFKNVRSGERTSYPTGLKLRYSPGTKLRHRRALKKPKRRGLRWRNMASNSTKRK